MIIYSLCTSTLHPTVRYPPAILLRDARREGKKIVKRSLANLSAWPSARLEALRTLLREEALVPLRPLLRVQRSLPHGHVAVVLRMIRRSPQASRLWRPVGWPVHSFETLLAHLATPTHNTCQLRKQGPKGLADVTVEEVTEPTALQSRAAELVELFPVDRNQN